MHLTIHKLTHFYLNIFITNAATADLYILHLTVSLLLVKKINQKLNHRQGKKKSIYNSD